MNFEPAEPQKLIFDHLTTVDEAMLFVGMGIGKTSACLWSLDWLLRDVAITGVLVVAPLRVANLTWPMEMHEWEQFRWMKWINLRRAFDVIPNRKMGKADAEMMGLPTRYTSRAVEIQQTFLNRQAHVYLINYDSLNVLVNLLALNGKNPLPFDCVIFDESTKAKNPGSKRINLYRRKVPHIKRTWALTGTPAPNSLLDLFAQVRLVDNGKRLGNSFESYKQTYFKATDYMGYNWREKVGAQQTIEGKLADMTLTLRSSDWLDIPDTVVEDVEITLPHQVHLQYMDFEEEMVLQIEQEKCITVANSAVLLTKLLQFTSGAIYDEDGAVHHLHDCKMDALKKIVSKTRTPVLVAAIFRHEQEHIRALFPTAVFFDDAKTADAQKAVLDKWSLGAIHMLVAHPGSIGHGLNLQHGSNTLVWISLTFSRELYEQMIARLARRGQKEIVTVYRLMCPGTVDDVIAEALTLKADNEHRLLTALAMLEGFRGIMK